jgi:ribosome assembly protein RRB1
MSKRAAEDFDGDGAPLKGGERLLKAEEGEGLEYEDEFEDEFESEDEILEAGVDGRPDAEREAEEKAGLSPFLPWVTLRTIQRRR